MYFTITTNNDLYAFMKQCNTPRVTEIKSVLFTKASFNSLVSCANKTKQEHELPSRVPESWEGRIHIWLSVRDGI